MQCGFCDSKGCPECVWELRQCDDCGKIGTEPLYYWQEGTLPARVMTATVCFDCKSKRRRVNELRALKLEGSNVSRMLALKAAIAANYYNEGVR